MFKVVSDQLKVSGGWVRCGQCSEVFDAQLCLQSNKTSTQLNHDALSATPVEASSLPEISLHQHQHVENAPAKDVVVNSITNGFATSGFDRSIAAEVMPGNAISNEQLFEAPLSSNSDVDDTKAVDAADAAKAANAALEDVSFVRNARRQAFWRKPLIRSVLLMVALALIGLFGAQIAVQQQSTVLAFEPRLKPWLQQFCSQLACEIGVAKQIEAIVIESSSFSKASTPGSFRLSFAMKNTSNVEVAMPSLEVTLTDTQEQTVIQRVLSPVQFGASSGLLPAKSDYANSLTLQIQPDVPFQRIVGYRVLAFYP